jgi:hypothetical protein
VAGGEAQLPFQGLGLGDPGEQHRDGLRRQHRGVVGVVGLVLAQRLQLQLPQALGVGGHLLGDRLAVVGQRDELVEQHAARRRRVRPHRPHRVRRLPQQPGLPLQLLVGAAAQRGQEQVVQRLEVVEHQRGSHLGGAGHLAHADLRVPLLDHQPLGDVEQVQSRLGVLGAHPARCGHIGIVRDHEAVDRSRRSC